MLYYSCEHDGFLPFPVEATCSCRYISRCSFFYLQSDHRRCLCHDHHVVGPLSCHHRAILDCFSYRSGWAMEQLYFHFCFRRPLPVRRKASWSLHLSLVADIVCSLWRFYGTNVYWLQMATDDDIDWTFHNIATTGFRVVRTWAFNDVPSKPSSGTYFQVLFNRIFFFSSLSNLRGRSYRTAKQLLTPGRMVFSALTKSLRRPASMGSSFCSRLPTTGTPRGPCKAPPGTVVIMVPSFLEAFSPMTMVRSVTDLAQHYLSYLIYRWHRSLCSELPSRWHPRFVLHWQQHHQRVQKLRCSSGSAVRQQPDGSWMGIRKRLALLIDLPSVFELQSANHYQMGRRNLLVTSVGDVCSNRFYFEIFCITASYIKTLDSNHLVTAGYFDFLWHPRPDCWCSSLNLSDGGFYCLGCPKLYAKQQATQPSPLLPGHSFDGSYGVDTEDILASPCIDFGSLYGYLSRWFYTLLTLSFKANCSRIKSTISQRRTPLLLSRLLEMVANGRRYILIRQSSKELSMLGCDNVLSTICFLGLANQRPLLPWPLSRSVTGNFSSLSMRLLPSLITFLAVRKHFLPFCLCLSCYSFQVVWKTSSTLTRSHLGREVRHISKFVFFCLIQVGFEWLL